MKKLLNKFTVLAAIVLITIIAIFSVSEKHQLPTQKDLTFESKKSATGAYLSGQHAARKSNFEKASSKFLQSLNSERENSALSEQVLELLIATGKYEEAFELAEGIESKQDSSSAILILYAREMRKEEYGQAIEVLNQSSEENSKTAINQIMHAWANIGTGDNDKALEIMNSLDKRSYFKNLITFNQALIAEHSEKNELAKKLYKQLLDKQKPSKKLAQHAYRFFTKVGDEKQAKEISESQAEGFELSKKIAQPSAQEAASNALNEIATIMIAQQNFGKASVFFRIGLLLNPENEEALVLLATILSHERDFASANIVFEQIAQESELYNQAKLARAQNYLTMENELAAKKLLIELSENEDTKIEALMTLGDIMRRTEDFVSANEYYSEAVEASKTEELQQVFWPLYFARGVTFERMKKWDESEADFKKALELEPNQADVLNYLAYSLLDMNMEDRFDEALEMLEISYEQRPNDAHILDSIGWAWFKKGDYAQAVEHLEKAASDMPYDPTINEHLGDIYWKLGREAEAKYAWKRALQHDPEERFLAGLRNKVSSGLDGAEEQGEQLEIQAPSSR